MAVDSRAAAPHAPGPVPRASLPPHRARHGPLVRRRSAAAIGPTTQRRVAVDAPQKAAPPARASRMSVGVAAHVFSGNCGVVRRSKPLNPRADCVLGHGVAMALRYHFFSSFRLRPLGATALRLLEQVQGILDAVRAVYGGTGNARLCLAGFFALFFIAAIPRRPNASDAVEYAISHLETTPKTPAPRRHATANEPARGRRRRQPHPGLRPRLPPAHPPQ